MQNCRYNSPDYMRRANRGRTASPAPAAPPEPACPVCRDDSTYDELSGLAIAMAYVPWEKWRNICEPDRALRRGTIFEDLDKPFRGIGGCQNVR